MGNAEGGMLDDGTVVPLGASERFFSPLAVVDIHNDTLIVGNPSLGIPLNNSALINPAHLSLLGDNPIFLTETVLTAADLRLQLDNDPIEILRMDQRSVGYGPG